MLLVDDGQAEALELDRLLDEGVRPHADGGGARCGGPPARPGARARAGRRTATRPMSPSGSTRARERPEVLLGEDLGRRHEHRLASGLHGRQERHHGHDRLAGADVALQEPVHGHRAREVRPDLGPDALLRGRERERQRRAAAAPTSAPGGASGRPCSRACRRRFEREAHLQHEEVLEGESAAGRLHVVQLLGEVHGSVGRGHGQEVPPAAELLRQDVGDRLGVSSRRCRAGVDRSVPLGQALGERVDWHDPAHVDRATARPPPRSRNRDSPGRRGGPWRGPSCRRGRPAGLA